MFNRGHFPVTLNNNAVSKVVEFKDLLVRKSEIPAIKQKLIYRGIALEDDQTLDSYGLQADHTIHLVIDKKDLLTLAQNPFAGTTRTTPPSNSNPLPNTTTGGGDQINAGTREPYVSGVDRPTGGMPDMLCPAISQMMQTLPSSPHIMDQIIGQNPQLHSMFDSNPQLIEMMQNSEAVCQLTSQMMQVTLSDNFLAADI
ncbi:ubiquitin family protein [Artemisia annua]|uniref:Ubiquitin family protein n=1 Tax=Artemisia annua TaxID=35608 RepID=A0A2U1LJF7_ARTAN|nr:ubiquitin family protein [Artemisia annua]